MHARCMSIFKPFFLNQIFVTDYNLHASTWVRFNGYNLEILTMHDDNNNNLHAKLPLKAQLSSCVSRKGTYMVSKQPVPPSSPASLP